MVQENKVGKGTIIFWSFIALLGLFCIWHWGIRPMVTCMKEDRTEAWKKFDESVKEAAKGRYGHEGPTSFGYQDLYARQFTQAVSERDATLGECNCDTERPIMDEEDIQMATLELKKLKERVLIKTALSYTFHDRAIDSTGTKVYWWINKGDGVINHPIVSLLSQQGMNALTKDRGTVLSVIKKTGMWSMLDEFQPLMDFDGPQFLEAIDKLHNDGENWNENGLSPSGEQQVYAICAGHGLNKETISHALQLARQ